jgi:hypothetical protein
MANTHNTPEDVTKNYLGLALMMGLALTTLQKYGEEVEVPAGHIEDRMIELMELREGWR